MRNMQPPVTTEEKFKEAFKPVIFTKEDKQKRTIMIPNLTPETSEIFKVAVEKQGYKAIVLPLASEEAVELGKRYVHNDICFPAQLNVGELLLGLKENGLSNDEVAVGLGKNCKACRALQYYVLARKGLDEAGFKDVPVVTTGDDSLGIQPGFKMNFSFRIKTLQGMIFADSLNELRQKVLPYELTPGSAETLHRKFLTLGMQALSRNYKSVLKVLEEAVQAFNDLPTDRSRRKPVIGIVGEILVNYHPTANYNLVQYLRENDMETNLPPLLDFFKQESVNHHVAGHMGFARYPSLAFFESKVNEYLFNRHLNPAETLMQKFKYYEAREGIFELAKNAEPIMNLAFNSGEGWLMPGEIISLIKKGVKHFIIVQPFGCLPNHISGRGAVKAIKERHPAVQILSLDYDPDVSRGNIENRLQMLIINARNSI